MPEVVRLVCDCPDCENDGDAFTVDDGVRKVRVIFCPDHRSLIEDAFKYGTPTSTTPRRGERGLSRARLNSLRRNGDR